MKSLQQGWVDRLIDMAQSRALIPLLLLVEILETTIVPFPYEVLFVALCAAAPKRIGLFLTITVLGSAIGGALVYWLGASAGGPVADLFGVEAAVESFRDRFRDEGGLLIFLGGLTPVPSYLTNLAAGASRYPFWAFLALFTLSRFLRFAILAAIVHLFGDALLLRWRALPKVAKGVVLIAGTALLLLWMVSVFI